MHKQLQWIILISLIISNTFTGVHQWHKSTSREFFYYRTILKKWTENFNGNNLNWLKSVFYWFQNFRSFT